MGQQSLFFKNPSQVLRSLADLRGECPWHASSLRPKIFSISCSILEILEKIMLASPPLQDQRPLLREILDPPLVIDIISLFWEIKCTWRKDALGERTFTWLDHFIWGTVLVFSDPFLAFALQHPFFIRGITSYLSFVSISPKVSMFRLYHISATSC